MHRFNVVNARAEATNIPVERWEKRSRLEVSGYSRNLSDWQTANSINCKSPKGWDFKEIADLTLIEMIRREAEDKHFDQIAKLQELIHYSHNRIIARCILSDHLPTTVEHTFKFLDGQLDENDNVHHQPYRDRARCEYALALMTFDCKDLLSNVCVLSKARALAKLIEDPVLRCKAFARICRLRHMHEKCSKK